MKEQLIGRKEEQEMLESCISSDRSEFIAVYGRRRVGKTFFIRNVLKDSACFSVTGMANVGVQEQLMNFYLALQHYFPRSEKKDNWLEMFAELARQLERSQRKKKIIFIDEMPWMDSVRSGFLSALEHFWNSWASARNDIKLIVCGSATSWMIDSLINNRGGLHNRVTRQILLEPFTLKECQQYFKTYGYHYSIREIADCYMVLGGVPYYLSMLNKEKSVAQNIDDLFFSRQAQLKDEFHRLFNSLFLHSEDYISIVNALSQKMKGLTRKELLLQTHLQNNARFTKMLGELEKCGFIRSYEPIGETKRDVLYQLIDNFVHFYTHFVSQNRYQDEQFWIHSLNSGQYNAWSGYAFEMLCLNHISQLKKALGINGVRSRVCTWSSKSETRGAQVDLIIDRVDDTVNICEMKYARSEYEINKSTYDNMLHKVDAFLNESKIKKSAMLTLVTSFGVKHNKYSGYIQKEVCLKDLFES